MSTSARQDLRHLELVCFGPPTARVDGDEAPRDVLWRKHLALLIYLALSPDRTRSRDHLLGLLWPEKTQEKARHSLNEAMRRLRTSLGANRLTSQGDSVILDDSELALDVERLEASGDTQVDDAMALLRGDFLEGFVVENAPDFEDWASSRRAHYRSLGASLLIGKGESALAANRFGEAQRAARDALVLNSTYEPAARLLIRASALAGDMTGALAAFQQFAAQVRRDIGEEPSRELAALAERARSGRWQRTSVPGATPEPILVGRGQLHQRAFSLAEEGLEKGARTICVAGDPGMGKSRLLSECVDRLALTGATVAAARPLESDHDAPWSTLRLLFQAGLSAARGAAGADPHALSVLASIVPELADRFDPAEPRDSAHVAGALTSYLGAISDEQPIGLAVDNAHLADGVSIGALGAALRELRESPIVLILAADDSGENAPTELVRLRGDIGRGLPGLALRLHPLEAKEMHALVRHMATWCKSEDDVDRLARRIVHEVGGSPFLAVTLLRNLDNAPTLKDDLLQWPIPRATFESPLPFTVPDLARMAILSRVGQLDEDSQEVLRAASIGGTALDTELIAALAEKPARTVDQALDRLEEHRFVVYNGTRYGWAAPLLAHIVRAECVNRGRRQRMRRKAAEVLESRSDLESRVLRLEMLAKTDPSDQAVDDALAVAKQAMGVGSGRTARRAVYAAEQMMEEGDARHRDVAALRGKL